MKKIQGLLELRTVTNEMVRLIETATAPVLAVDIAGNINGWNHKAAELTGLPVMEAIGRPLIDLVVADSIEVVKQILDSALQGLSLCFQLIFCGPQCVHFFFYDSLMPPPCFRN